MGQRLALLIATYQYQDTGLRQLTTPAHDAEALGAVLRDPAIAGFEVTMLINEPHHRVGQAIGDFYRDRRRDDLTLLYFTGHGLKDDDGRLYLAMTNTLRDNLLFTGLPAEQVDQAMESCVSRQKVLVLDCCYSGAFPAGRIAKADTMVHALERFQGRGRTVLTASDATQYSFEGDQLHGQAVQSVFTRYLVAGLRDGSADLDGDGDITLDELYSYVHDRVVQEMPQQRPKKQDNVEGRTVIARNINWTLPTYLRNAIGSPIAADRLAALDGLAHLSRIGNDIVRGYVQQEIRRLADDDSRLVSAAATTLLQAGHPQRPETTNKPPEQPADQVPNAPETPEPAVRTALGTPTVTRLTPAITSSGPADFPAAPQTTTPQTGWTPVTVTGSHLPSVDVSTADVDADRRTPRPAIPHTAAGNIAPPRHTGGPAADHWSRMVPRTRRAKALTAGVAVVALAITVVMATLLTDKGGTEAGFSPRTATILPGYTDEVAEVTFSPDGKALATTSGLGVYDQPARLWDVATGQRTATLTGVYDVEFSLDSKTLATLNGDDTVRLWDAATRQTTTTLTLDSGPTRMAFSPDGTTLATARTTVAKSSYDNPVHLWNVATGQPIATLAGHTNGVQSMAFSADGKTLATGAAGGTVLLWDVAAGKTTATLTAGYIVELSPDGKTLATSDQYTDNLVRLWDVATGKTTASLAEGYPVAFSPDGTTLATASHDNKTALLWDVTTGQTTATFTTQTTATFYEGYPLAFSPDSTTLAIGAVDNTVLLWDVATGQTTAALTGHTDHINDVAFSPDGTTLATASSDKTVRLWRVAS